MNKFYSVRHPIGGKGYCLYSSKGGEVDGDATEMDTEEGDSLHALEKISTYLQVEKGQTIISVCNHPYNGFILLAEQTA